MNLSDLSPANSVLAHSPESNVPMTGAVENSTVHLSADRLEALDELLTALQQNPHQFDFFKILRRLECAYNHLPRLGTATRLQDEFIRLAQQTTMAFAPSTLAQCEINPDQPLRLSQYALGLLGPQGPLPLHLTEYIYDRLHNAHDPTLARFLDVFHHRLLSLFYRAWAVHQPAVSFDRPDDDRYALYVGALFGLGMPSLIKRNAVPDLAKFYYAGRLSLQTHPLEGLQAILSGFFQLPMTIYQWVGRWVSLAATSQCQLGQSPHTGALGQTLVVGARVWDCQHSIRIVIGPLSLADYQRLLPGGLSLKRLVAWVRHYTQDELAFDVQLILKKEEIPPLQLGSQVQLGFTLWLTEQGLDHDADDLLFEPLDYEDGFIE